MIIAIGGISTVPQYLTERTMIQQNSHIGYPLHSEPLSRTVQVVIADDFAPMCQSLKRFLSAIDGVTLLGMAHDGMGAVELCLKTHPDVIFLDISMPKLNGIDVAYMLRERCPEVRVIALIGFEDAHLRTAMLRAGAVSCVAKYASFEQLHEALVEALKV